MSTVTNNQEKKPSFLISALSIIGFIAIIVVGIWGTVQAIRLAPSIFSYIPSPFGGVETNIDITLPGSNIESGKPFELTWQHDGNEGRYAFSYQCRSNFSFHVAQEEGVFEPITCENPIVISSNNTLRLLPISEHSRFLDVPVAIAYFDAEGEITADGTRTITIVNSEISNNSNNTTEDENDSDTDIIIVPTGNQPNNTTPTTPAPATPTDLSVRILATGIIDPATRAFVPTDIIGRNDTAAVRFEVKNIGGKASGQWKFVATLPTDPTFEFKSERQQSLGSQDRIEYTLRFDQLRGGSNALTLHVDSTNEVVESSKNNNTLSHTITVQ